MACGDDDTQGAAPGSAGAAEGGASSGAASNAGGREAIAGEASSIGGEKSAAGGSDSEQGGAPQAEAGAAAGGATGGAPDSGPEPDPEPVLDARCASASAETMAGTGTAEDPYLICLPEQLLLIDGEAYDLAAHYALGDDVKAGGIELGSLGGDTPTLSGSLDGRYHLLGGLSTALFVAIAESGVVRNLHLIGNLSQGAGLLAGTNDGLVENVSAYGTYTLPDHAGALIGVNHGEVVRCSSSGTILMASNHVGGLVGQNSGHIFHSFSSVDVTGGNRVGGLSGNLSSPGLIEESYAVGPVTGVFSVGGLVGTFFGGTIKNSYARSELVTGPQAGGLVGHVDSAGCVIENSYAVSELSGEGAQGLVGMFNVVDGYTISGSYYPDTQTSSVGTALSDAELKRAASYEAWDFDGIWQLRPALSDFPTLRFQRE